MEDTAIMEEEWLDALPSSPQQIPNWISEINQNILDPNIYEKGGVRRTDKIPHIHTLSLRDYQIKAIQALEKRSGKGILQMATGTGKTKTLIGFLYRYWLKLQTLQDSSVDKDLLAVILIPGTTLLIQWQQTLSEYFTNICCVYGYPKVEENLHASLMLFKYGYSSFSILLVSQFSIKKLFLDPYFPPKTPYLLIADEVHQFGAEKTHELLEKIKIEHRIGLSATPIRQFDEEGNKFIFRYFYGIIFRYGLKEAIKEGYLVPYQYEFELCELSAEEQDEYSILTKRIAIEKSKPEESRDEKEIEQLLIRRSLIIKKAQSKLFVLEIVLRRLLNRNINDHIVVFLEDEEQCNQIRPIVEKYFQIVDVYNAETPHQKRQNILEEFDEGKKQIVLTKRCWDQGVDIPSLKAGIIVSSTTNERQMIQRIGRLLRPFPGKDTVFVFDLVVQKYSDNLSESNGIQNLFTIEFNRLQFLKQNAINNQ
jgi:superfamily II DNA or RNA helicase